MYRINVTEAATLAALVSSSLPPDGTRRNLLGRIIYGHSCPGMSSPRLLNPWLMAFIPPG